MKVIICTNDQYKSVQGVHLRSPDLYYLNAAIQVADRDGFECIYIHAELHGLQYEINPDVLQELFKLTGIEKVQVEVVHPASAIEPNEYYRDFKIIGQNGYYRFETLSGGSVSANHWRTIRGVKGAIDREYRGAK